MLSREENAQPKTRIKKSRSHHHLPAPLTTVEHHRLRLHAVGRKSSLLPLSSTTTTLPAPALSLTDDLTPSVTEHLGARETEENTTAEDSDFAARVLREGAGEGLLASARGRNGRGDGRHGRDGRSGLVGSVRRSGGGESVSMSEGVRLRALARSSSSATTTRLGGRGRERTSAGRTRVGRRRGREVLRGGHGYVQAVVREGVRGEGRVAASRGRAHGQGRVLELGVKDRFLRRLLGSRPQLRGAS